MPEEHRECRKKDVKCRTGCPGEEADGTKHEKADEHEMIVKKEFEHLKKSGGIPNLRIADTREIEDKALATVQHMNAFRSEWITLRYQGITKSWQLAGSIDNS